MNPPVGSVSYGPNTAKVLAWLAEIRDVRTDVWRRILGSTKDQSQAFRVAAPVVERSAELRLGMLTIATETGRAVANARVADSEASLLLTAARNAGLAVLTDDLVPNEATLALYKPFAIAVPRDPLRPRLQRLLRASFDFASDIGNGLQAGPLHTVAAEFFAYGLALQVQVGRKAHDDEWTEVFLNGCMALCGEVAAFWLDLPPDFEQWFHNAVWLGVQVYVLGSAIGDESQARDFTGRVRLVTENKLKNAGSALPRFHKVVEEYGLLAL
jgi:hypothetical protein